MGVAKNARYLTDNLGKPSAPFFFLPEAQYDTGIYSSYFLSDIVIVTEPRASLSLGQVSKAMAAVDPNLPIISMRTLSEQVAGQFTLGLSALVASLIPAFRAGLISPMEALRAE